MKVYRLGFKAHNNLTNYLYRGIRHVKTKKYLVIKLNQNLPSTVIKPLFNNVINLWCQKNHFVF